MTGFRSGRSVVALAIGVIQFVIAWVLFAPSQLGGQTSYVILIGNSMEPEFRRGDLVLVRPADDYRVGDMVAYQHPEVGAVFHRIVSEAFGRYTLQGDNNFWLDSYQPGDADIIGKLWLRFPGIGQYLQALRTPGNFTLFVVGAVGILLLKDGAKTGPKNSLRSKMMFDLKYNPVELLVLFSVIAIGALFLAVKSFSLPITHIVEAQIPYTHNGVFSYTADVPPGVYDESKVSPGEPVYRQVTDAFQVSFDYTFDTSQVIDLSGSYQLLAEVSNAKGWKRTLQLAPSTAFTGTSFSMAAEVQFDQIQGFINALEEQTGVREKRYTLNIRPEVVVQGVVAGHEITSSFAPELTFEFDELAISLVYHSIDVDPLRPSQTNMVSYKTETANTFNILGFDIGVPFARAISVVGILVYLYGVVMLIWHVNSTKKRGELSRINMLYGHKIVSIANVTFSQDLVEVDSIEELAKIADQHQKAIMHLSREGIHYYFVQAFDITYLFRLLVSGDVHVLPPEV
ncbi:MAG: signal peptidase I [Chloroflexota bacterium]